MTRMWSAGRSTMSMATDRCHTNEDSQKQFQEWLKEKYNTLDSLNEHWATAYWSQTYDNWREIPIPVGEHNPGLMLEWKHFSTYAWVHYQQNQIDALKKFIEPRQFITGNFMGYGFDAFDHYVVTRPLTFVSWDDYVGHGHLDPDANGISHDAMRGLKRENIWIIETQPGFVNWSELNNALNKGETRAMAWHDIGHGADEVSYWQWRSALNGQEEIHGTLVAPDGEAVPLLEEVTRTAKEFGEVHSAFRGTRVVSQVALLADYDSRRAIGWQKHTEKYDQFAILKGYYHALRKLAQSIDIVSPDVSLQAYKLVMAPDLYLIPKERAGHLLEYVNNGGHLALGPCSALKGEFKALIPLRGPGYLAEALGGRVEQYCALEKEVPASGTWGAGEISVWAEQIKTTATEAEVLLRYGKSNGWLDGHAITRRVGQGRITYVGGVLDAKLMTAAAEWMAKTSISRARARTCEVAAGDEVAAGEEGSHACDFAAIQRGDPGGAGEALSSEPGGGRVARNWSMGGGSVEVLRAAHGAPFGMTALHDYWIIHASFRRECDASCQFHRKTGLEKSGGVHGEGRGGSEGFG
jgi:beta-galactosidase